MGVTVPANPELQASGYSLKGQRAEKRSIRENTDISLS